MNSKDRPGELREGIFKIKDNVHASILPYRFLAHRKGLYFDLHFNDNIPESLMGDYTPIGKVIEILADNSVRYTDYGGVKINISCSFNPENEEEVILKVSFADTGEGIDNAIQELIDIGPGKPSISSGLIFAKELIHSMEGKIRVIRHSNFHTLVGGSGTTFWFTIKLKVDRSEGLIRKADLNNKESFISKREVFDIKILVVDDNVVVRKLIGIVLEELGYEIFFAINGNDALARNLDTFDLILMDIQMPELNGLETTKIIRSRGLKIPIIGVTANFAEEYIEECLDSGMDDFLSKPIDQSRLQKKILKLTNEIQKPARKEKKVVNIKRQVRTPSEVENIEQLNESILRAIKEQINNLSKILIAINEEDWGKIETVIFDMKFSLKLKAFFPLIALVNEMERNGVLKRDIECISFNIQEVTIALEEIYKSLVIENSLLHNNH